MNDSASSSSGSLQLELDNILHIVLIGDPSMRTTICDCIWANTNTVDPKSKTDARASVDDTVRWTAESTIEINKKYVRIRLYDSMVSSVDGAVFLCNASNSESFHKFRGELSKFYNFVASSTNATIPIVLLSVHQDAQFLAAALREGQTFSNDEAKKFAQINCIKYFENVLDAFHALITEIMEISAESTHPRHISEKSAMFRLADIYFNFSIIMLGDTEVGKSNLMSRFIERKFSFDSKSLIGVDFKNKSINIDSKKIVAHVFDTNTSDRFRPTLETYYRHMVGAVLVYDITRYSTFDNIQSYLNEFRDKADKDAVIILVGNKNDLQMCRTVTTKEAEAFAKENQLLFTETSALEQTNVEKMFRSLLTDIYYKIRSREELEGSPIFPNCKIRPKHPETQTKSKRDTKCKVM